MDFYELLNEDTNSNDLDNQEICLISQKLLEDNYITLDCNHKFNLIPLYSEVIRQKNNKNYYEITNLKINQIKCPYCRTITNKLLPYNKTFNKTFDISLIRGVNYPQKYCMKIYNCEWKIKTGKNKGNFCNCSAVKTKFGILCDKHLDCIINKNSSNLKNNKYTTEKNNVSCSINDDTNLYKKYKVTELKEILKSLGQKVSGNKSDLIQRLKSINYQFN